MNAISTHSAGLLDAKQTVLATALLATFVASVPYPIEAHATAYGYDYWGTKTVKDIPIPSGQLFWCRGRRGSASEASRGRIPERG